MAMQCEYHIEEWVHDGPAADYAHRRELKEKGWGSVVIQWLQRADGSAFQVLVMSRMEDKEAGGGERGQLDG